MNQNAIVRCVTGMKNKVPLDRGSGCVAAREDASGTKEQKH